MQTEIQMLQSRSLFKRILESPVEKAARKELQAVESQGSAELALYVLETTKDKQIHSIAINQDLSRAKILEANFADNGVINRNSAAMMDQASNDLADRNSTYQSKIQLSFCSDEDKSLLADLVKKIVILKTDRVHSHHSLATRSIR